MKENEFSHSSRKQPDEQTKDEGENVGSMK